MAYARTLIALALLLAAVVPARLQAAPFVFSYGGRLADGSDNAVAGPVDLELKFYTAASGGTALPVSPVTFSGVALTDGVFQVDVTQLHPAELHTIFGGTGDAFVEVTDHTHNVTYPRQKALAVPFALTVPVDGKSVIYDGNGNLMVGPTAAPAANQFLTRDATGTLVWGTPTASTGAQLGGQPVNASGPSSGQILMYSNGQWIAATNTAIQHGGDTGVGSISLSSFSTLGLGTYDNAHESTLTTGLKAADAGKTWFNTQNNAIMVWNGVRAGALSAGGSGITQINGDNSQMQTINVGNAGNAPSVIDNLAGTHTINIPAAGLSANGYLASGDWAQFNARTGAQANASVSGFLNSSDWVQFNARQLPLNFTGVLQNVAGNVSVQTSGLSGSGFLTSADWATFNAKQMPLGNANNGSAGILTATDWTTFNGKQNLLAPASASTPGFLASSDWASFNARQTPLTFTGVLVNTAGSVSLAQANLTTNGFLASGDWATFNGKPNALAQANLTTNGFLASGDWALFNTALRWDGGATGLNPATGRTSLGINLGNAPGGVPVLDGAANLSIGSTVFTPNLTLGTGDTSLTPQNGFFRGQSAVAVGTTDKTGGSLIFNAGNGTGAGGSGFIAFQTAFAGGGSSSALDSITETMRISPGSPAFPTGFVGIGTTNPQMLLTIGTSDAATATVTNLVQINHGTSGVPAAGFGTGLVFTGRTTTVDNSNMASIQSVWTTATQASQTSQLQFQTVNGGGSLAPRMTIDGFGNVGLGTTNPTSTLTVVGSIGSSFASHSATSYTLTSADSVAAINAAAGAYAVTIPSAAGIAGRVYTILKTDTTVNVVTITPLAGNIAGNATLALKGLNQSVTLVADGANWQVIGTSPKSYSARISNNGASCAVITQDAAWISGTPAYVANGECDVTAVTGIFANAPACTCTSEGASAAGVFCSQIGAPTATLIKFGSFTATATGVANKTIDITCNIQ